MAGDEQQRRPRPGIVILGEGLTNTREQGAREHRGSAGMLSPNSIWTEIDRRGVIDGGVELGSHRWRWRPVFCRLGRWRVVKGWQDRFRRMMWC
jgi:hypothetical protein